MDYIRRMSDFFLASVVVHLVIVFSADYFSGRVERREPPVQVRLIEPEKPKQDLPEGRILDQLKQEEQSATPPEEAEYLAAHSLSVEKETGARRGEEAVNVTPMDGNREEEEPRPVQKTPPPVKEVADVSKAPPRKYARAAAPQKQEKKETPVPEKEKPDSFTRDELTEKQVDRYVRKNPGELLETGDEAIVSLNTRAFEYADYFASIRRALETVWYYPPDAMERGIGGSTLLRFTLSADGTLQAVSVVTSAGSQMLDGASIQTVQAAGPFLPFPEGLDKKRLHIVANFTYRPTFSAVNRNR